MPRSNIPTEYDECVAFWAWFRLTYPKLESNMFHVPNERQEPKTRIRLSKIGVQPGVSDYVLLWPKGPYHGLVMEVKRKVATPDALTEPQKKFLNACAKVGYMSVAAIGLDQMMESVENYLNLPDLTPEL